MNTHMIGQERGNSVEQEHDETQIAAIRDLMLEASTRGSWLTLAEIAACTGFGEASISAQLRHLRKPQFGRFRVEKQRREEFSAKTDERFFDATSSSRAVSTPCGLYQQPTTRARYPAARPNDGTQETAGRHSAQNDKPRQEAHTARSYAPWEYRVSARGGGVQLSVNC